MDASKEISKIKQEYKGQTGLVGSWQRSEKIYACIVKSDNQKKLLAANQQHLADIHVDRIREKIKAATTANKKK